MLVKGCNGNEYIYQAVMKHLYLYFLFFISALYGNPIYQLLAFFWAKDLSLITSLGGNQYRISVLELGVPLLFILLLRILVFSFILHSRKFKWDFKGAHSLLYLYFRANRWQSLGLIFLPIWLSGIELNVVGFIFAPLAFVVGMVLAIVTFREIRKIPKLRHTRNEALSNN